MQRLKPVDLVIIGGGWTGLAMANELTSRTALSVVVLERGAPRKPDEYLANMDEVDYSLRYRMLQNIAEETVTHRHASSGRAVPVRQYGSFNPGTGVGGAGEHWGAVSYRYLPEQFRLASHLREMHGAGRLPQNLAVQDWGLTYDDLEPYYWRAEQMMGVAGKAGNLRGERIAGGNVFEGPRSHEYPVPPHKNSHLMTMFREAALSLGYHPYPVPTATLSETYRNPDGIVRPGCAYCGHCTRYGCMISAKAQPTNTLLPLLQRRKTFALRPNCWARRVVHRDGRVTGIQYTTAKGEDVLQPAGVVILTSFTLNNNRLLLLSRLGQPYDPATGKGTLGKNLTHQVGVGTRLFFDQPLNAFMGAGGLGMGIDDFDGDHGADPDAGMLGLLRGGTIRVSSGGAAPVSSFGHLPPGETHTEWGSAWKQAALRAYDRAGELMMEGEHLSYRENCFDLDPAYTDKFGDPLLRLTLDWNDHERQQAALATRVEQKIGQAMGATLGGPLRGVGRRYSVTYYQSTHIQGGVIMGVSPETSVVNPWLQHWQAPNLFVIGGSAFPQNASGNPTLTILALAYRAADALVDRYLKRPGPLA